MSRRDKVKFILFAILANVLALGALFAIGEFAMRWRLEGSLRSAMRSFFTRESPAQRADTGGRLVYDAVLGYKLNPARPGVNSLGIRHAELGKVKPDGLFRVVVLGDSVAWDRDGFVKLLRDRFSTIHSAPAEVINAAIPGYTTYQERMLLERELLKHEPDLVILQYCLNDHHKFLHMLNESGRWLVTPEAERLLAPEGRGPLAMLMRSSYLLLELRLRASTLRSPSVEGFPWDADHNVAPAWQDETWPDLEEHLRAMRESLTRIHARFAVIAVPLKSQLQPAVLQRDAGYTLKPQRKLAAICERLGVPFLDLHPEFHANRTRNLYRDGLHLNALGHELTAQHLLAFLEQNRLAN